MSQRGMTWRYFVRPKTTNEKKGRKYSFFITNARNAATIKGSDTCGSSVTHAVVTSRRTQRARGG